MRLIKLSLICGLLALASPAMAQSGCGGQFPANQFCGTGGSQGLPGPRLIPAGGTTPIPGGTVLGNNGASNALPSALTAPVLGIPGTSIGQISFANTASGVITLQPTAGALGVSLLTLPAIIDTVAGFKLANGGTNASLTASNGGIFWSNATQAQILAGTATARQMLQSGSSATPAWSTATWPATTAAGTLLTSATLNTITASATPVLGVPASVQGTLGFAGVTGGTATVTAQATAGSPTITLPNTTGTLADGASTPLVLNATTGNLTCPSCVTSSGGGAITGTPPIAVSAAGAVSITGAAGQVLAGASPAFTATPVLGVAGSTVGTIGFQNASTGTVTLSPVTGTLGTVTATLPANTGTIAETNLAQTWSAVQSINSGDLSLNGSGSGATIVNAPASGGGTATFFPGTDTIAGIAATQTLTNKTISGGTLSGVIAGTPSFSGSAFVGFSNIGNVNASSLLGNPTGGVASMSNISIGSTLGFSSTTLNVTTCSATQLGACKPDGTSILVSAGTISTNKGATLQASPANPTSTASTVGVMMGLGSTCNITPIYSSRMTINFFGAIHNATGVATAFSQVAFGTGTAPANGAAITGTAVGVALPVDTSVAGNNSAMSNGVLVTGLTPGTAYWVDLIVKTSNTLDAAVVQNLNCSIAEF